MGDSQVQVAGRLVRRDGVLYRGKDVIGQHSLRLGYGQSASGIYKLDIGLVIDIDFKGSPERSKPPLNLL